MTDGYEIYYYLIYNFFRVIILCGYIPIFLKKLKDKNCLRLLGLSCYFIINSFLHIYLQNPHLDLISNILLFILYSYFFKGKFYMRILCVICVYSLAMIYEGGIYFFISKTSVAQDFKKILLSYILSNIFIFITQIILKKIFNKNNDNYTMLKIKHWITLLIISISSIYLASPIVLAENWSVYNAVAIILILIINILVFYFFYEVTKYYKKAYDRYAIENRNKYYKNQLKVIMESEEAIRKLKHDYKNHMIVLMRYFEDNNKKAGIKYIENLIGDFYSSGNISETGNIAVDSLLNYKLKDYKNKNINLKTELTIPSENLFVLDYHIDIILGNLLDNAIYAVDNCDKKEITVVIKYINKALFIRIENTFNGKVNKSKENFKTIKTDKKNHGYGLKNVKRIVELYNGQIDVKYIEDKFLFEIFLYNNRVT